MKFKKAVTAAMAALLMVTPASVFAKDDGSSEEVNIVYTHDIHSFLEYKKDQEQINAAAKLKSYIDSEKQKKEATFVVDAGDFSMGTLYGTGFQTEALELMTLGRLGYDACLLYTSPSPAKFPAPSKPLTDRSTGPSDHPDKKALP